MRTALIVLLVTMTMLPLVPMVYPPSAAENISIDVYAFGNGQSAVTVDFPGPGTNDDYNLSVQDGMYIDDATLKVSTVQPAGTKDYPTNLTVDFGGDGKPEWAFKGPGYGQLGRQTVFTNGKSLVNLTVGTAGNPYDNSLSIRLPKNADIKSAKLNISVGSRIGTPGKILIIYSAGGYGYLNNDIIDKLTAFTGEITQVDTWNGGTSTPNWDDIKDYYGILLWNLAYNGARWSDQAALGDLMADYVDAGGGVVCCLYLWMGGWSGQITGRFNDGGYYCWNSNLNGMGCGSNLPWGSVQLPDHPVMSGVSRIDIDGQMWTGTVSLSSGAHTVFTWSNGAEGCSVKSINGVDRCDIQMTPYPGTSSAPEYSYGWSGDGDVLIKNALLWSGRKPLTATIDILNDSIPEFTGTDFQGNFTFPNLDTELRNYLATANVSFVDAYGNAFVDVPINVTAPKIGLVQFNQLDITYDYTTNISVNPAYGDLPSSLYELQKFSLGTDYYSIPIVVSSESAGSVRLFDIHLKESPPFHTPTVSTFFPAANTVVREDSSLDLGVNATDIYGNPVSYSWSVDGMPVDGAITNRLTHYFDLDSSGTHFITANVSNPISAKSFTAQIWNITVLNVNRPPTITDSTPVSSPSINENSTQLFTVTATDPDKEDANGLSYTWFLDGKVVPGAAGNNFTYVTSFRSSGQHVVKVVVSDASNATDSKSWAVTVIDVDVAPAIAGFSPRENPTISETDSRTFSVTPLDPDENQTLIVNWYVDDVAVFIGNPYTFTTDYRSAGVHTIKATVSDGQLSAARSWTVTVLNLNRVPLAVIDSPSDQSEYMQGDAIHFSGRSSSDPDNDALTFIWTESDVNVSDQMEFDRAFPPGIHTLVLEVRDGQGGMTSASVRFRVKYIELAVVIGLDLFEVKAGNKVTVIVTLSDIGDANASNLPLTVSVDSSVIGSSTVTGIDAGGATKQSFTWKATKGDHTITAKIGDQTWTKQLTVEPGPAPSSSTGAGDYIWMIVLVVLVVGLVGFGAAVLRKKEA